MEDERNRGTRQKVSKSTEELSQIREEVKKYKSMGDVQCLVFLEDLWIQKTETSSPKSKVILYLQSELAHTYLRLGKFSRSQNLYYDLWERQKEILGENHLNTLATQLSLAQAYRFLRRFEDALAILQDLLDKQRRVLGENHLNTLATESLLGQTYGSLGRFENALAVFQDVLEKQRRILGENHPETLITQLSLAQAYGFLGGFEDALAVLQNLLNKQRRILGESHPNTLIAKFLLGQTYLSLNQFEDALAIIQDLLDKQRHVLGENHPDTLGTEFLLGQTYLSLNQFEDALTVLKDLLNKQRLVLDEDHLATLSTEFLLGQTYLSLNQFEDALTVARELLDKQRRILGENHLAIQGTEFLLGQTYLSLKQFEDALTVTRELLDKQRRILGENYPVTLSTELLLGQIFLSLGRLEDALTVLKDLLDKQRRILGENHPDTLATESLLGQIYGSHGRFEDALAAFQDVLEKQRRILGETHPDTLVTQLSFAQAYKFLRRFEDALVVLQDLLDKQRHVLGETHPVTLGAEFFLSRTYLSLNRLEDALTVARELLDKQRRILGENHPDTLATESLLGQIYGSLGRLGEASAIFQDVLEKQRRILGENHPGTLITQLSLAQVYGLLRRFKDALAVLQDLLDKQRHVLGETHPNTLIAELLLAQTYISLNQSEDALAVARDLLNKQRRVFGENHPVTLATKRLIEQISYIDVENEQPSSLSDEDTHIENVNFDFSPIPDYGLISRFQQYDFDFSRSKEYSEQTGVPVVDSLNSDNPGFSVSSFEDFSLEVKNFLNLGDVQLNIRPIMCIYGKNQAGKSNISRLLYGFQHSSTKIVEKLKDLRYSKRVRSLPSELNSLKSKFVEASLSKDQRARFTIPEDVHNLLVGRLRILIEEQISEMPTYFYSSDKNWKRLIGLSNNNGICYIHSSRSSFHCDLEVNAYSDEPTIKISLEPKSSFKIEIELVYESDERSLIGSSIFEVIYNLSSLRIHFSGKQPISIPLKKINLSDNLEHLPILHHVMHFSGISYISDQDSTSLKYEEIPRIINNSEMVSKAELDVLDNRLVYLIYDTLLIELWKLSPFSFFTGDVRFFPAERGGILERIQTYAVRSILQEEKIPEGLKQYSRLIEESLSFLEENRNEAISKLSIQDQNLLREIESDLIDILYHLELKVSQDEEGASKHVFVKKTQDEGKEDKREFVLSTLPSSVFSLFALNLHIRLSKLKMMLFYEEPETHLHPSSIEKLCDLLVKMYQYIQSGEEHNLAMVFTTHSGFFLNFLFLALEREYGLNKMKEILSVVRLFTDDSGSSESEAIMITEEGYSGSPFDEEELKIYEELTRLYDKYVVD